MGSHMKCGREKAIEAALSYRAEKIRPGDKICEVEE